VSTAAVLARKEGVRLVRSPLLWVGFLLSFVAVGIREGQGTVLPDASTARPLTLFPIAGMVLIASAMAVLRSRRHGTEELFSTLPAGRDVRTLGHLLASVAAGLVAVAILVVWVVAETWAGAVGSANALELAVGPLLVIAAAVTGVALARLAPWSWLAVPMVVAIGFLEGALLGFKPESNPLRSLAPWAPPASDVPFFVDDRAPGWHLVYLAGVVAAVALIAMLLAAPRGRRPVALGLAGAVLTAAAGGWMQTRPLPAARAAEVADIVARPTAHQACRPAGPDAVVCTYAPYRDLADRWAPVAASVLRRAADVGGARTQGPLVLRQRFSGSAIRHLAPATQRLLPAAAPRVDGAVWPADGEITLDFAWPAGSYGDLLLATTVAASVVGLPTRAGGGQECDAAGQARGAAGLWLAVQASPGGAKALRRSLARPNDNFGVVDGRISLGAASYVANYSAGVRWGEADARLALALADRPVADVADVMRQHWTSFMDPATPSQAVAAAFGMSAPSPTPLATPVCR
jgi:hypothetical protein